MPWRLCAPVVRLWTTAGAGTSGLPSLPGAGFAFGLADLSCFGRTILSVPLFAFPASADGGALRRHLPWRRVCIQRFGNDFTERFGASCDRCCQKAAEAWSFVRGRAKQKASFSRLASARPNVRWVGGHRGGEGLGQAHFEGRARAQIDLVSAGAQHDGRATAGSYGRADLPSRRSR